MNIKGAADKLKSLDERDELFSFKRKGNELTATEIPQLVTIIISGNKLYTRQPLF